MSKARNDSMIVITKITMLIGVGKIRFSRRDPSGSAAEKLASPTETPLPGRVIIHQDQHHALQPVGVGFVTVEVRGRAQGASEPTPRIKGRKRHRRRRTSAVAPQFDGGRVRRRSTLLD